MASPLRGSADTLLREKHFADYRSPAGGCKELVRERASPGLAAPPECRGTWPRRWRRRTASKRLRCCPRDIGPERIKRVLTFEDVAGASSEG
jgi:hypothetical protein